MSQAAERPSAPEPVEESLRARASRGAVTSLIGQGASQSLRLVGNLLLARMLYPEAFGLMAIVNMLLLGLQAVSDFGLTPAIIRHDRDDRAFLDTAWTLSVTRGFVLFGVGCALAYPMSLFYRDERLLYMVPVAALTVLIMGFGSTKGAALTRQLRPARVLVIEVGSQAVGLATMLTFAKIRPSVWALVVGGIVSVATRVTLSHFAIPGPGNRLHWEQSARDDLLHFGKWLLVSSIFTFVSMRADVAMLGRLLPFDVLGVYSIGIMISLVVREVMSQVNRFVLMPALSFSQREGVSAFAANFGRIRRIALPAALFAILAATALSPPFFQLLYDDRYHAAAWIAQLSMVGVWFHFLTDVSFNALMALGESRAWAATSGVRAFGTATGCIVGFWLGGLPALMVGGAVAACLTYAVSAIPLSRHGVHILRTDAFYTTLGLALGCLLSFVPRLGDASAREVALRSLALGALVLIPYGIWIGRRLLRARSGEAF